MSTQEDRQLRIELICFDATKRAGWSVAMRANPGRYADEAAIGGVSYEIGDALRIIGYEKTDALRRIECETTLNKRLSTDSERKKMIKKERQERRAKRRQTIWTIYEEVEKKLNLEMKLKTMSKMLMSSKELGNLICRKMIDSRKKIHEIFNKEENRVYVLDTPITPANKFNACKRLLAIEDSSFEIFKAATPFYQAFYLFNVHRWITIAYNTSCSFDADGYKELMIVHSSLLARLGPKLQAWYAKLFVTDITTTMLDDWLLGVLPVVVLPIVVSYTSFIFGDDDDDILYDRLSAFGKSKHK